MISVTRRIYVNRPLADVFERQLKARRADHAILTDLLDETRVLLRVLVGAALAVTGRGDAGALSQSAGRPWVVGGLERRGFK